MILCHPFLFASQSCPIGAASEQQLLSDEYRRLLFIDNPRPGISDSSDVFVFKLV